MPAQLTVQTLSDFPEYRAAAAQLFELRSRRAEAQRIVAEPPEPEIPDVEMAARTLLESGTVPDYAAVVAAHQAREDKHRRAEGELPVITRAIELAEQRVRDAAAECGAKIGAKVKPWLCDHAKRFAVAALEARAAAIAFMAAIEQLRGQLEVAGVKQHGLPLAGLPGDNFRAMLEDGPLEHIRRLASYGLVSDELLNGKDR